MNASWPEARRLFDQALHHPQEGREVFVRQLANDDVWLRATVLELLELDAAESPLDQPLPHPAHLLGAENSVEMGDKIGRYQLLERIATGGMGSVYRAERVEGRVRQEVAVKVLGAARLDGEGQKRFLQEQRIMAGLRHPNIVQLLDFGTTPTGLAYLVMELVEGMSITEYAAANQLSLEDRIQLVLRACDAVRHAHHQLVVHRDLKPANMLVTFSGELRLVDFGIAKMLDPDEHLGGAATRTDQRVMTPNYASPEQLLGHPITTATDVWALGAVLFELLVGRRPFDWSGMTLVDIERKLEVGPTPKASASLPPDKKTKRELAVLRHRLRGDLDMVLSRALAFRRGQRYDSVEVLAADLERYLGGLPVLARRPSWPYVTGKFIRRHSLAVAVAGITLLAFLAVAILQTVQSRRLEAERDIARQQRDEARLMRDLLGNMLEAADPGGRKPTPAARALLHRATRSIVQDFDAHPTAQAGLMTQVGQIHERLGDFDPAEDLLTRAADIWRQSGFEDAASVGETLSSLGFVYHQKRDPRAIDTLRRALDLTLRARGEDHPKVALTMMHLAAALNYEAAESEAEALLRRAVAIDRRLNYENVPNAGARLAGLANQIGRRGDRQQAIGLFDQALEIQRTTWGERSVQVSLTLNRKASLFQERPVASEGARLLHIATQNFREILGDNHPLVATGLNNLAGTYLLLGDFERAESLQRQAWDLDLRRLGAEHPSTLDDRRGLAMILREQGRLSKAEDHLRHSLAILATVVTSNHPALIEIRNDYAEILFDLNSAVPAARQLDQAFKAVVPRLGADHWLTGRTLIGMAEVALTRADFELARSHAAEAARIFQQDKVGRERWRLATARSALGAALAALQEKAEAEEVLNAAVAMLRELRGPSVTTRKAEARLRKLRRP